MSTVFKLKRSSVKGKAPTTSNIELGEIAINTNDGRLFFKTTDSASSSAIVTLREISAGTGMTQTGGELKITDTGVVSGSYGSSTEIPILSINAQGQIDSATTVSVAGVSGLAYDSDTNLLTLSTADGGSYSVKIDLNTFTDSDTTDDLPEGSTNQYFTNARVQTHLGAVTGSIIPNADSAYDLGSPTNKFRDLYLSNNSIFLGGIKIQADEANNRLVVADSQGNTNNFSYDLGQNTTDDLPEGTSNLYYDSDRTITTARHAISASGNLSYNATTGVISYTDVAYAGFDSDFTQKTTNDLTEGGSNLYFTNTRARQAVNFEDNGGFGSFSYDTGTGVFSYTGVSTTDIRNQFSAGTGISISGGVITNTITQYTDALARGSVSATDAGGDGSFSYDSSTGIFTYTGPSASEVRAHFSAGTGIGITNGQISTSITQYDDADARGAVSASTTGTGYGNLTYDESSGVFTFSKVTDADIRGRFTAGTGIGISNGVISTSITQYADDDARAAVSVNDAGGDGSLSYDSNTGIFTYTGPSASEVRAHFSGGTGISITNGEIATSITQYTDGDARGAISVTDNGTFGSLSYNSGTGTLTYNDIDSSDIRAMFSGGSNITISPSGEIATGLTQYTDDDARATVSVTDAGGDGSLSYDSNTGIFTYTGPSASEARSHFSASGDLSYDSNNGRFSFTERTDQEVRNIFSASGDLNYDSSTGQFSFTAGSVYTSTQFDSDLGTKTTDDLAEGTTNLYYDSATTQTNARNAISVSDAGGDGSLAYNASTGTITYTGPSASETRAHFSGGTGVTITNGSVAIGQSVGTTDDVTFGKVSVDSASVAKQITFTPVEGFPSGTQVGGELFFDSDPSKALSFTTKNLQGVSDVTINIGQEEVIHVMNKTGATLTNGTVVELTSTDSATGTPLVKKTNATNKIEKAIGVCTQDIPDMGSGYITTQGVVRDVNTGYPFTEGDTLYICMMNPGTYVRHDITPDEGYPYQLGTVLKSDSSEGSILVAPIRRHWDGARFSGAVVVDDALTTSGTVTSKGITFDGTVPEYAEGTIFYDSANGAIAFKNDVSDITMQVGQEDWVRVYNNSGSQINNGQPVHINGSTNNTPTIELADATDAEKVFAIGLATHNIANGSYGYVTTKGVVNDVDTSAFSAGDKVHVGTTAGTFSTTAPTFPNYAQDLGYVLTAASADSGGSILVSIVDHTFEVTRTTGDARVDGNLTVAGNVNILGTETKTAVQSLSVGDPFIYVGAGDTITTIFGSGQSGLNDLTFKEYYEGDSDRTYFVKITATDSAGAGGDTIQWGFDSADGIGEFTPLSFDSDGGTGPTSWRLGDDRTLIPLRYNIKATFAAAEGHTVGNYWKGAASPVNRDIGIFGNYNTTDQAYSHAGIYRDIDDKRWKFVGRYDPEVEGNINTGHSSFEYADVQASRFYGDVTGDVSGNANTATTLETPRTIGISGEVSGTGVSFNGSQNITISGTTIGSGVIDNDNISSSAAITDGKLATISTAGKVNNSATSATSSNNGSTIVLRDASGNFSAGTITANLTGNVTGTVSSLSNQTSTIRGLFSVDNTLSYDSSSGQFSITNPGTDSATTHAIFSVDSSANTGDGSLTYNGAGVFTYKGPTAAETRAHFSGGTGITITNGSIATSITQYADADARSAISLSADNGISTLAYNSSTGALTFHGADSADIRGVFSGGTGISINGSGVISTSITQYADADARGAISRTNTGTGYGSIDYNSSTGVINFNKVTDTNIRSAFSAGTGISISSGQISTSITQYTDADAQGAITLNATNGLSTLSKSGGAFTFVSVDSADVRGVFSAGTGISIGGTGEISTSITQYTDADARGAVSGGNTGTGFGSLGYNSSTGAFTFTKVTKANVLSSLQAGTGINLDSSNGTISTTITQYADADARSAVSGGNTGTGFGSLGYNSSTGAFTFTKVTKANVLSSIQAGTGITLDSSNGTIATTITQYADADARGAISRTNTGTGFGSIDYNSSTGVINYNKVTKANIRSALQVSGDLSFDSSNGMLSFSETYSTAAELLTALKTVDTNSSGLNADTLDGEQGSHYRINVYNSSGTLLN